MSDLRTDIIVNVRLPDYKDQLVAQVGRHVADLTHALRALQDGSFVEQAKGKGPGSLFHVEYPDLDVTTGAEQRHVQNCFRAVIAAFIAFLDQMIAMGRLAAAGIPIDRTLSEAEVLPYVRQYVEKVITTVASDRSLTNPKKIAAFSGLSEWAKEATAGLFALRRCYEHHGGVAESDFVVRYRALRLLAGKGEITALPFVAEENTGISIGLIDKEIVVKAGERPELTEQQLRDIVNTIELPLATEILLSVEKRLASKGVAEVESRPTAP